MEERPLLRGSFRKCNILSPYSRQRKPGLSHKRANDMRTLESVLLLKALWKLCVLSLSSHTRVNCKLSHDCDPKAQMIEPLRACSRGRLEKLAVCGSVSALFLIVSRCSRAPCRPSAEALTFSMAHIHLLVEGAAASLLALFAGRSLGSTARNTGKSSNT